MTPDDLKPLSPAALQAAADEGYFRGKTITMLEAINDRERLCRTEMKLDVDNLYRQDSVLDGRMATLEGVRIGTGLQKPVSKGNKALTLSVREIILILGALGSLVAGIILAMRGGAGT